MQIHIHFHIRLHIHIHRSVDKTYLVVKQYQISWRWHVKAVTASNLAHAYFLASSTARNFITVTSESGGNGEPFFTVGRKDRKISRIQKIDRDGDNQKEYQIVVEVICVVISNGGFLPLRFVCEMLWLKI